MFNPYHAPDLIQFFFHIDPTWSSVGEHANVKSCPKMHDQWHDEVAQNLNVQETLIVKERLGDCKDIVVSPTACDCV